jgi:preprotein translocase subunit SecF
VILYVFSVVICDEVKHYVDGLFFGTICTLLAVMMVYKYWDSITKEDLEFSVGSKQNVWEVKELLNEDELSQSYSGTQYGAPSPQQQQQYQHQQNQQQQQQQQYGQQYNQQHQQQYPY